MRLSQGKGIVDDVGLVNTVARTKGVTEGLVYNLYHPIRHTLPEEGTPHCPIPPMMNTLQETCPPPSAPIPSEGVYVYPYIPLLMMPSLLVTQVQLNLRIVFTQSLPVQSSDDQKERERKNAEFLIQLENTKTQ